MRWRPPLGMMIALLTLSGCTNLRSGEPLSTVASVDLTRYAGTWYEIASLPMWFQRHGLDSKAIYTILQDGKIGVHNECLTDKGHIDQTDGVATVVDSKTNARLTVTFDNWFARLVGSSREGTYWITDLDEDYHTALIGTPDRRFLWILSRRPQLDESTYRHVVTNAHLLGFPVSELITRKPSQRSN